MGKIDVGERQFKKVNYTKKQQQKNMATPKLLESIYGEITSLYISGNDAICILLQV